MINNITGYKVGDLIESRYRVVTAIGQGGMGEVYRVADIGRGYEEIALKLIRKELIGISEDRLETIIQREIRILTQLWHPNLIEVYNYGITEGGNIYYSMAYVDGPNLGEKMDTLGINELLPMLVQICRALAYLHARGVIHGDLKPANVLLEGKQVRLVDFGLARDMNAQQRGQRYFSPFYAAPELAQGQNVDGRADLYSLGAIAYTWLVGEPPDFMISAERLIRFALGDAIMGQQGVPSRIGDLIARLLAQDPGKRYATANEVIEALNFACGSSYALETKETASSYALRTHFVGRGEEQNQLQDYWKTARHGQAQLVLISGESGVGKTRLVEELEVKVKLSGSRAVWGQCLESGGSAYQPWREILRVLLRHVEGNEGFDGERLGPVLAAILPELWDRSYMVGLTPPTELAPAAAQQRLNDAILKVLQNASEIRPTMVIIEDAHWADEATQVLINFLARALYCKDLMVCVTYRSDEIDDYQDLDKLSGNFVKHIQVGSLTPKFTQALVGSMLGVTKLSAEMMATIQRTTEGNTFFVQELIRTLAEEGTVLQRTLDGWQVDEQALDEVRLPESIQQVIVRRLERLAPDTQRVLRWAAVAGSVFWEGALENVSGLEKENVAEALSEAAEKELIILRDESSFVGERECIFVKPIMQQVSYASIPPEEQQEAHARVAAWLLARSDAEIEQHLGLVAETLQGAGQSDQAAVYLTKAGEQAAAQFANTEAANYLSRALDLTSEDDHIKCFDLLLTREKVYGLQGAREKQQRDLSSLESLVETLADDWRRAAVALRKAYFGEMTGNYSMANAAAQEAINLALATTDPSVEAAGYLHWGRTLRRQGEYEAARIQLEKAQTLARAAGQPQVEANCLQTLGSLHYRRGEHAEGMVFAEQSLLIFREIGDRHGEGLAFNNMGTLFIQQGDYAKASAHLDQALAIMREVGGRRGQGFPLIHLGIVLLHWGKYAEARAHMDQALHIFQETRDRALEGEALHSLGLAYHLLGDNETAHNCCQEALLITRETDNRRGQGYALTNLGHALAGLGNLTEAADAYQEALILRSGLGELHLAMESRTGLACVNFAQGDRDGAQAHVDDILDYLRTNTVDGVQEPLRLYLRCYRVLQANQDPRATEILKTAYHKLQHMAAKISADDLRRSLLENVRSNRKIVRAYDKVMNAK